MFHLVISRKEIGTNIWIMCVKVAPQQRVISKKEKNCVKIDIESEIGTIEYYKYYLQ